MAKESGCMKITAAVGLLLGTAAVGLWAYGLWDPHAPDAVWAAGGVLAGLMVAAFTAWFLCRRTRERIRFLTDAARAVSQGEYTRGAASLTGEWEPLSQAVNALGESLQKAREDFKRQRAHMKGVLEGMDDGVVAVDEMGRILLCNDRAAQLLGKEKLEAGQLLDGGAACVYLREHLQNCIDEGQKRRETFAQEAPEEQVLDIYFAPIRRAAGALAVMADVTKIRKLESLRSQFVANVTHELKTPLTSIMGYIELLKSGRRDEEVRTYFYEIMQIEAERLQNLIDDLLQLSEIENNRDVNMQVCSARDILENTIHSLEHIAAKQEVSLSLEAGEPLLITANPRRLRQLFTNLVDNAIKYNRRGGTVAVTAASAEGIMTVRIADTGIGIEEKHFERLFERFYRVDKSRSREMGGTGLGLSIVKHIVQLYDGEIQVESRMGEGSVFTVRLPLQPK